MNSKNKALKKIIKYRLSYSGTKETDILYNKLFLNKLDILNYEELLLLSNMFKEVPDTDLFDILTNKLEKPIQYKDLITKIINE